LVAVIHIGAINNGDVNATHLHKRNILAVQSSIEGCVCQLCEVAAKRNKTCVLCAVHTGPITHAKLTGGTVELVIADALWQVRVVEQNALTVVVTLRFSWTDELRAILRAKASVTSTAW
jgi:hypothetical protein